MNNQKPPFDNEPNDEESAHKSKTAIKKEMSALTELGKRLVELPEKELATIPLPDQLLEQIQLARRITQNSGKKRQLQYIGKLMRSIEMEPILAAYDELLNGRKEKAREFHQLEKLRDGIVETGDDAINEVLVLYPAADRQQLRQLSRAIQKEKAANKPPAAARKLFKYLRELHENEAI